MAKAKLVLICLMASWGLINAQQGQQLQQQQQGQQGQQGRPVQRFNGPQNGGNPNNGPRPQLNGQRQSAPNGFNGPNNGPNGFGPNGPNGFGPNTVNGPNNRGAQRQFQPVLSGQPSLVNIGGCSRGVSLRNADGSTLVCGFGPRDFACPPGFACTFDNGLRALVCCPSGDNVTLVNNKDNRDNDEPQPNPCPDHEPIKDEFGNRLKCDFSGGPSNTCPAGTLCVVGACCPVSVAGLISVKPGQCPLPLPVNQGQSCTNDCTFDADCPGPSKCCFVGCGARCVASVASNSPQVVSDQQPQNPQLVGGPLSDNGVSLARFNLQQQGQLQRQGQQVRGFGGPQQGPQGPQGPQQNNPFFNQQSQQFEFPNRGPPGTFGSPGQQQQQQPQRFGQPQQPQLLGGPQQPRPQQQFQQQNNNRNNQRQFNQA